MRRLLVALAALVFLSGCSPAEQPQSGLPKAEIVIDTPHGAQRLSVELAATEDSRRIGLMFRDHLGADEGMLFDFGHEQFASFWMKNTVLALDMIFIKADGTISTIAENTVPYSEEAVPSSEPVQAVLEINGGRARALGIAPGEKVHAKIFGNGP
jgi:uncharacterized membrane protein (UPF0127 family)